VRKPFAFRVRRFQKAIADLTLNTSAPISPLLDSYLRFAARREAMDMAERESAEKAESIDQELTREAPPK